MASACCCRVKCVLLLFLFFVKALLVHGTPERPLNSDGKLSKPIKKSFKSPDGDTIDCVSIHQQPSFDHPLLKNTHIQRSPSNVSWKDPPSNKAARVEQLWHQTGHRCPFDTIPIRRTHRSGLMHGLKSHAPPRMMPAAAGTSRQHEHAIAYVEDGVFYGAAADINIWGPTVEVPDEFSLSQIWILSGKFNSDLNSVEAGWQVDPVLYGDTNPRFFTYWTSDSYKSTGCYNLICQGFVQVSDRVVLGGTIAPVSSRNSAQYDIRILIFKDLVTGNWWLRYGDELIGYWPGVLFTRLSSFATIVEWGGEVVNSRPGNRHTSTQMGSGEFASHGFGRASYLKDLQVVDFTSSLRTPGKVETYATRPNCYDIQRSPLGGLWFFGGPGLGSSCP